MAERQVGKTLNDIRVDHKERYNFAIRKLQENNRTGRVLDAGCGIGYGSYMMSDYVNHIHAVELSQEAYKNYKISFQKPNILFDQNDIFKAELADQYDAVICFEFLEHIEAAAEAVKRYASVTDLLISSTPNEEVRPWAKEPINPYHVRHYTPVEYKQMLTDAGFKHIELFHQKSGSKPEILPGTNGKFMIAVSSK
jgi:2-polyprenyl-3-methyl-5-hydroxy-6-metoxy-1,4-benzoquinol methylase